MNYFKILLYLIVGQMAIAFMFSLPGMTYNIVDIAHDYNAVNGVITLGTPQSMPISNPATFQPLVISVPGIGNITIPWLGEIMGFIVFMFSMGITMITTLIGYIVAIATLGGLFPIWVQPIWTLLNMITLFCVYKAVNPMGGE